MDTEPETSFKKRFLWVVLGRNKSNIWRIAMAIQNQERKKERISQFHNFTCEILVKEVQKEEVIFSHGLRKNFLPWP